MSCPEFLGRLAGAAAALLCAAALAAGSSSTKTAPVSGKSLKPSGPVTIDADHADWKQNESMLYSGHVRLNSADLQLSGDRLELKQYAQGEFEAHITGDPATLNHKGLPAEDGTLGPPVTARAKTLHYDSRNSTVTVEGEALLTQGDRRIQGENIVYNVTDRRVEAKAQQGGQVHIELPASRSPTAPPPPPGSAAATSPAAAPALPPSAPSQPAAPAPSTPAPKP